MYFGMLVIDHKDVLHNDIISILSVVIALALIFVRIPWPTVLVMCELPATLLGCALFFVLFKIGTAIMNKDGIVKKTFTEIGAISYPIFLLQHVVIEKMLNYQNPYSLAGGILVLILTIVLTVIYAKALSIITNAVTSSSLYLKLEKSMLKSQIET